MITRRSLIGFAALNALFAATPALSAVPWRSLPLRADTPVTPVFLNTDAQIYLLRGLANVFSRGMDEMGARLQSYGFAPRVINHRGWQTATDTIVRNYRNGRTAPIILIGHSLGANAAFQISKRLQSKGIPVAYLATFDPVRRFTVPANVQSFVNFYQNNGHGRTASFPDNRREDKVNLNLTSSPGVTHTNIDQNRRLQNIVIARIWAIAAR